MSKKNKDALILGFALFSMFFGAGNLIFPPFLGITSGNKWYISGIAFCLTGVGITMLGILTTAKVNGDVDVIANRVSKNFSKILGTLCMICIGPLFCIPRTAATTYEISIRPVFGDKIPPLAVSIVFFAITLYFLFNESTMMDKIGRILTPVLLLMVVTIIVKAFVTPLGPFKVNETPNLFLHGFKEGYQTMDSLGAMFMSILVINALIAKGYKDKKEQYSMCKRVIFIAGLSLALVYIGLTFVGATASTVIDTTEKSEILVRVTSMLLGKYGAYALAIGMFMACLTTSIGLTATVSSFFTKLSGGRIPYYKLCVVICIFSTVTSIIGLDNIIAIAVPVLTTMYPMVIVLIVLSLFDHYIKNKIVYKGAVFGAFLVSVTQSLYMYFDKSVMLKNLNDIIETFPFAHIGLHFVVPSIISAFLFLMFSKVTGKNK